MIAELPWGRAGLTICYDVRFPGLYTHLAETGAEFIGVPSAFTRTTGRAHWHLLLRARAIETGRWFSPPRNAAIMLEDVKPTVIRLSSTRGAK